MSKIKVNLSYNLLLSVSQIIFPLFTIPYIARTLTPNGIGQVSFADSFAFYFTIIAEFGIMTYGVREVAKYKNNPLKLNKTVSSLLSLHILSSLLAILIFSCFVVVLRSHYEDPTILIFSYLYLFANAFACEWYFYGQESFKYIAIRAILVRIAGIASIYIFVKSPDDYLAYYAIIVFSAITNVGLNFYNVIRKKLFSFDFTSGLKYVKQIMTINAISILAAMPLLLDNVIIGIVASATTVGLYAFTVKIVRISSSLITDSMYVFFPSIVALKAQNKQQQLKQQLTFSIQLIILFATPLSMGIFLLADEIIPVFLGESFIGAIPDLRILALYPIIKSISLYYSNPVLMANHYDKSYFINLLAACLLFFALAFAGAYYYQAIGMCIALLIAEFVLLILNLSSIKKHLPALPVFSVKAFGVAVVTALSFYPIIYAVNMMTIAPIIALAVKVIACLIVYLFIVFVVIKPIKKIHVTADENE